MYQSCRFQCCVSDRDILNNMVEKLKSDKEEITYLKWSSDVIYIETRNRKTLSYFKKPITNWKTLKFVILFQLKSQKF